MSIRKASNSNDLTEDEIAFFKSSSSVPPEVKAFLARQHENLGTKTDGYRKVSAAARAECDAMLNVRELAAVQGELVMAAEARAAVNERDREIRRLTAQLEAKEARLLEITAKPALVVHSGDG